MKMLTMIIYPLYSIKSVNMFHTWHGSQFESDHKPLSDSWISSFLSIFVTSLEMKICQAFFGQKHIKVD